MRLIYIVYRNGIVCNGIFTYVFTQLILMLSEKSLKIPKVLSNTSNQRWTNNAMAKGNGIKQTMIYTEHFEYDKPLKTRGWTQIFHKSKQFEHLFLFYFTCVFVIW